MQASIGDESRRAWDIAVFGADCFKADQKGQKCRKTRVFLHPIEPTNLCWLSQWKSNKDSLIDLLEVAVELPDRLEVFAKIGRQHFLVLKHPKKKLILSFDSKKEKEAFALVSSIIHSRKGVPRSLTTEGYILESLDDTVQLHQQEALINHSQDGSRGLRSIMTDNLPKAPALDGYPDLMRRLLTLNFKDYAKILDSPGFPFNTNQQLEEQSRMFAVTQVSGKPWWISKLPALASSSSSLVVYLFSSFNSIYDTPARALSLADCLFKTCTFGNSGSTSLENRIREAISEQFRWMYFGIKVEPQVDGPFWNLTTSAGDESYPLLAAIELLLELGFLDSSLPIILRLCLNQIEGLEDHLSDLQETLLTRFHGKVICTPAHHQSATLESLRFKILLYFTFAGSSDKIPSTLDNRPIPLTLLGDLVLDSDEQKNLSSPPKQNGLAGTTSGNASHADPKTSLSNLKTGSESQPAKADNILLYSVMQGSPESKARETKPQTKISLKKLTINSGSGSSASNKVIGPIVDKDKSSVQGDELAYSFLSNSKFRGDNQGLTAPNYDQIYGGGREEGDANTQELSISPTKVRRTPLSHVRTSQRSSHYSEYLTSLRQVGSKDYMQTGCFNILKIKTALQLKKVTEGSLDHENCKPGLVSLDELLVSRLQKEVSGLFKHGYMIEAPLSNLQNDGSLNVSLLKSAVICGLNSIPVDLAALSTDDKALYNSLFEVLPNACPGFRRSNGVVCIKRCKDHFRHLKTNLQSITKCCIRVHAAIKMGHFFFKLENSPPGSSSPKKGKLVPNYSKLEIRISEWFNHSWSTRLHVNCEYDPLQELNYYFEDDQIAEIVERPSEMKRVKLEIWGYGGSSSNDSKLLEEKTILPALCLPGYRTIYFGPDNSSHLVVHFTINPIQTSS